jgi:hypothetical protein
MEGRAALEEEGRAENGDLPEEDGLLKGLWLTVLPPIIFATGLWALAVDVAAAAAAAAPAEVGFLIPVSTEFVSILT